MGMTLACWCVADGYVTVYATPACCRAHMHARGCLQGRRACMHVLSTIISSCRMSGYCLLISRTHSMKRPSVFFMMFALCTAVTFLRLLSRAYWNAYCATRMDATRVMTCTLANVTELHSHCGPLRCLHRPCGRTQRAR
jgi:hypothetical protein